MTSHEQIELLRRRIGAYRDDIRQLETLRQILLQRARRNPRPLLISGLQLNAETAAAVRYADRLARSRLAMLLMLTCGSLDARRPDRFDLTSMRN